MPRSDSANRPPSNSSAGAKGSVSSPSFAAASLTGAGADRAVLVGAPIADAATTCVSSAARRRANCGARVLSPETAPEEGLGAGMTAFSSQLSARTLQAMQIGSRAHSAAHDCAS